MQAAPAEGVNQAAAAAYANQPRLGAVFQRRRLQDIGAAEEFGAKAVRRIVVQLVRFAMGDQRPVFHNADFIRQSERFGLIVGDVEDGQLRQFAVQTGNLFHHVMTNLRIQRRQRFIKQQHLRTHGNGAGYRDALLLAAGKLMRIAGGVVRHTDDF